MTSEFMLATRIEQIAEKHGVDLFTSTNQHGSVFTTPSWEDWPDAMLSDVQEIAEKRRGRDCDYWVSKRTRR